MSPSLIEAARLTVFGERRRFRGLRLDLLLPAIDEPQEEPLEECILALRFFELIGALVMPGESL